MSPNVSAVIDTPEPDMPSIWGRLVSEIDLRPDMHRIGPPRLRQTFSGRHDGWHVSVEFDIARRAVRAVVALASDNVLSGTDELRIVPRAGLGGWDGGAKTGDDAFDAEVAILTSKPDAILLALDVPTRALLADMLEAGVWISGAQAIVEPAATASVKSLEEAGQLLDCAADLLRALDGPTPERLIDMAFGDPSARQRQRAWRHVRRMAGKGNEWVGPLLDAIERYEPANAADLLEQIAPRVHHRFEAWLAACDRHADGTMRALFAGLPVARAVGVAAVDAVLARIARGLIHPELSPPPADLLVASPGVVQALLPFLRDAPDGLERLLAMPLPSEMLRAEVIGVLGRTRPEKAAAQLVAMRPESPQAELAHVEALIALPPALGDPALAALRPTSPPAVARLLAALVSRQGPAFDTALATWAIRAPSAVEAAGSTSVFAEVARRLCAALAVAPHSPLVDAFDVGLPPPLARALTDRIVESKPRYGAWWLARHAPDHRIDDPKREAALLGVLAELGDPAGEPRCLAALAGSDFLRVAAARALAEIGTARSLEPLDELTGFFASGDVKAEAKAAIAAIRERELRGPRGGLTVSDVEGGELSVDG